MIKTSGRRPVPSTGSASLMLKKAGERDLQRPVKGTGFSSGSQRIEFGGIAGLVRTRERPDLMSRSRRESDETINNFHSALPVKFEYLITVYVPCGALARG
jgi:hypothetical protein